MELPFHLTLNCVVCLSETSETSCVLIVCFCDVFLFLMLRFCNVRCCNVFRSYCAFLQTVKPMEPGQLPGLPGQLELLRDHLANMPSPSLTLSGQQLTELTDRSKDIFVVIYNSMVPYNLMCYLRGDVDLAHSNLAHLCRYLRFYH